MIQICDDFISTVATCNRYSLGVLLYCMDRINKHGNIDQFTMDIYHDDLKKILGNEKIDWQRLINGLAEDVMVKVDNDYYCTLFTDIWIRRYPLYAMNYLTIKINERMERLILNLDDIGYSKVELSKCLTLLDNKDQGKRSLILYLYLCRERYKGDFVLYMPRIQKLFGIEKMDVRNATRRIINPCFRNVQSVLPFVFEKVTFKYKICGYKIKFIDSAI